MAHSSPNSDVSRLSVARASLFSVSSVDDSPPTANGISVRRPRVSRGTRWARLFTASRFAAVGASGLVVNQVLLWLIVDFGHLNYLVGAGLATQGSTAWNFYLNDLWVFRSMRAGSWQRRLLSFAAVNNVALLLRAPLLALLTSGLGIHYLVSNLLTLIALFVARFFVSDRFIWKPVATTDSAVGVNAGPSENGNGHHGPSDNGNGHHGPSGNGNGHHEAVVNLVPFELDAQRVHRTGSNGKPALPHRYDVSGFVSIASEIPLRELEYFRNSETTSHADIEIRIGSVGAKRPRMKVAVHQGPGYVTYEEHLGRLGANFGLEIGERIRVTVGPILAMSPHVVYTNVVEALLRFVLASRGRVLLHAATVSLDGTGVMLSAQTDTGKTGTILRLIREQKADFLADDMTILDSNGVAYCYPKPLTISAHTLRAVDTKALTRRERWVLAYQSRIHSKSGRSAGQRLANMNLPIMALNAVTQVIVPPPKYMITRLVDCRIVKSVQVRDLFVIERGKPALEVLDHPSTLETLVENTDDAYGFPPFRYFAPAISIGDDDYIALRAKERAVLSDAMRHVRVRRLARDDFSWADAIPKLVAEAGRGARAQVQALHLEGSPEHDLDLRGIVPGVIGLDGIGRGVPER